MNTYKAFGFIIESEIIIDELLTCKWGEPDIIITIGEVPEAFEDIVINTPDLKISSDKFLLDIKNVAKYYVINGKTIILEGYKNSSIEEVKQYLLGSCMGAVLFQKGILPLHGSCINIDGKGLLLTGESGSGKSTVSAVLYKKGYKMLTDDVAAIRFNSLKEPMVYPSYPRQKLWEDAIERIGMVEEKKTFNRMAIEHIKYSIKNDFYFDENPIPMKVIVEIIPEDIDDIIIEKLLGAEKFKVVMKNTYRKLLIEAMDMRKWHFKQCIDIANRVEVYRLRRPRDKHMEKEIANQVLENIL